MMKVMMRRLLVVILALVGAVTLGGAVVQAAEPDRRDGWDSAGFARPADRGRQIFSDDLTVEQGQVIAEDVTVFSGDVEIKEGGRIQGNLLVMSGDIDIEENAVVDGDVTTYSGNVDVAGSVGGNVASLSGNIQLDSSAQVQGDVSVVSGRLEREEGAVIGGNVAEGPSFRFPGTIAPDAPRAPNEIEFAQPRTTFLGGVLAFFGRVIAAMLMTLLAVLLVVGLFYVRPKIIADTRTILRHQTALSGIVGVVANLTLLFLAGIMAATLCLLPLALVPLLTLVALNAVGWAVASQIAGERIVAWTKQPVQDSLKIGLGAVALTGLVTLLWAMGGCFRPLGFLITLGVSSMGTGALILPWLNRRKDGGADATGGTPTPEPAGPTDGPGGAGATPMRPSTPAPRQPDAAGDMVETDVAAPIDYLTAEEVNEAARGTQTSAQGVVESAGGSGEPSATTRASAPRQSDGEEETVETDVAAPIDYLTAEEVNEAALGAHTPPHATTPDHADVALSADATQGEQGIELDAAGPLDYRTAQEINADAAATSGDDFTRIRGIGPAFARRLKQAGLTTFAALASATPVQIAEILGWPESRVSRDEIIDQAKVLAARG